MSGASLTLTVLKHYCVASVSSSSRSPEYAIERVVHKYLSMTIASATTRANLPLAPA